MSLRETFQDKLDALIRPDNAFSLAKSVWRRPELAEKLSGTSDHRSKAYKAALRNLERYDAPAGKQQRKPSKATLERLAALEKRDQGAIEKALGPGGARVGYDGEFCISEDCRVRHISFSLSHARLAEVFVARGDQAEVLWGAYGVVPDRAPGAYSIR